VPAPEYYYFAASLPMLMPDNSQGLTVEAFLEACEQQLSGEDFDALTSADASAEELSGYATARAWQQHDREVRNLLAELRGARLGIDAIPYLRPDSGASSVHVGGRNVFENESPLRAEEGLFKVHWQFLEDLVPTSSFDLDYLTAYYLKLQLLERLQSFDHEAGQEVLEQIRSGLAAFESNTDLVA
jgi:hypothetical protein|tara:strand:- start:175 stop:732 length:558 start_codon:yes stop_codon:yes gene_type:complete